MILSLEHRSLTRRLLLAGTGVALAVLLAGCGGGGGGDNGSGSNSSGSNSSGSNSSGSNSSGSNSSGSNSSGSNTGTNGGPPAPPLIPFVKK